MITNINSMQTSCFFVLYYLNSITFITGGIGGSDFLSSQILESFEQISSFFNFLSNARFWFSSLMWFVSGESGITLLLLN